MPTGDYLEGAAVFALMLAGTSAGAALLLRRRLGHLDGAARVLALGMLITLGIVAVHLAPAMLGLLGREAVLVATAIWALAATFVPAAITAAAPTPSPPGAAAQESRAGWTLALLGAGFTAVFGVAMLIDQSVLAPGSVDVLNFHLPGIASWIETGSIWQVDNFLADVAPGNYPNNGDLVLLAAVLPWSNDFLSHLAIYPFWALSGVAVYGLAAELRAPRPSGVLAGCLLLVIPVVAIPALVQSFPDALLLASFGTGVLFLIRHQRSGITAELVLAGLALGIAFGTKWYGVSSVAVVVAVWFVGSLLARREPRVALRHGAVVAGLVALAGGVWLLRNWIESGNPFFPVRLAPLGIEIFNAPRDLVREVFGFTIADYVDDPAIWRDAILPQYRDALAAAGGLIVAGIVAAVVAIALRRRTLPRRGLLAALAAGTVLLGVAYSVTPYTAAGIEGEPVLVGADSRYLLPTLLIGAALTAWATGAVRWGAVALGVLALPALVDAARLASNGTNSGAVLEVRQWLRAAVVVALLAGLGWVGWRVRKRLAPRAHVALLAGAAALAVVAVAVVGNEIQQRFNATRYLGADPTTDYVLLQAPSGNRIGLAGGWDDASIAPPLPAFGPRYGNEVEYVGEYVEEMLRQYPGREEFVAALDDGGYDLLIVGRGRPPKPFVVEERWAQSVGWERIVASERLALYRAPGTAAPAGPRQ